MRELVPQHRQLQWEEVIPAPEPGPVLEYLLTRCRSTRTQKAYWNCFMHLVDWCNVRVLSLWDLKTFDLGVYLGELIRDYATSTVKQNLAAIRGLYDFAVEKGLCQHNPAACLRGPLLSVQRGKTPALSADQVKSLFDAIPADTDIRRRDKALLGCMYFAFARVGAVCALKVEDLVEDSGQFFLRLFEKGGKVQTIPVHHKLRAWLSSWLEHRRRWLDEAPYFLMFYSHWSAASCEPMTPGWVWKRVKKYARKAGLPATTTCHSLRVSGITHYLEAGGNLETARVLAGHSSMRTTQLYDRRSDNVNQSEIERIRLD